MGQAGDGQSDGLGGRLRGVALVGAAPQPLVGHGVARLLEAGAQAQHDAERGRVLPVAAGVAVLGLLVEAAPARLRACGAHRCQLTIYLSSRE